LEEHVVSWIDVSVGSTNLVDWLWSSDGGLSNLFVGGDTAVSWGDAVLWDVVGSSGVVGINDGGLPVVLWPWVEVGEWGSIGLKDHVVGWVDESVWSTNFVDWLWTSDGGLGDLLVGGDAAMSWRDAVLWDII